MARGKGAGQPALLCSLNFQGQGRIFEESHTEHGLATETKEPRTRHAAAGPSLED